MVTRLWRIFPGLVFSALLLAGCGEKPTGETTITHGPLLGRLGSDRVAVWARTSNPGSFHVVYGTDPGKLDRESRKVQTHAEDDNTGWILLTGLKPYSRYYYRLVPGKQGVHSGHFTTLPDENTCRHETLNPEGLFNFSFEFACGNNQTEAKGVGAAGKGLGTALPTFRTIMDQFAEGIWFSIQNGDWLYESDGRAYPVEAWLEEQGLPQDSLPGILRIAPSLVGVWENYKEYLENGANLREFHRYVPCFYTYDDHEILNDVIGSGQTGYRNRRAVFRDIGATAWYDYIAWSNPVDPDPSIHIGTAQLQQGSDVLRDMDTDFLAMDREKWDNLHIHWGTESAGVDLTSLDSVGGDPNAGVYEIREVIDAHTLRFYPDAVETKTSPYSIGTRSYFRKRIANCDFFFIDTRSHRMVHDHLEPMNPEITMLGEEQREWLLEGIADSRADFIFVISSVNFSIPHVSGGPDIVANKDDAWTAFQYEREVLIDAFEQKGIPVFVLTGDLHNSFAIRITDNVWEFASGPRNSRNHHRGNEGFRPATGNFTYGNRTCDILWSTYFLEDTPQSELLKPSFCIVRVNNVLDSPSEPGISRYYAYERPQVVFSYYSGLTGELLFSESVRANPTTP